MVLVCVPFMLLVVLLQTRIFTLLLHKAASLVKRAAALALFWLAQLRAGDDQPPSDSWSTAPEAMPMGRKRRLMAMEGHRDKGRWPWSRWLGGRDKEENKDGAKV
jgi:hypothetical protein